MKIKCLNLKWLVQIITLCAMLVYSYYRIEMRIVELEDKLTITFAEMENQRRRFEKEKDDAFEYGGFSFAKDCLLYTSDAADE